MRDALDVDATFRLNTVSMRHLYAWCLAVLFNLLSEINYALFFAYFRAKERLILNTQGMGTTLSQTLSTVVPA